MRRHRRRSLFLLKKKNKKKWGGEKNPAPVNNEVSRPVCWNGWFKSTFPLRSGNHHATFFSLSLSSTCNDSTFRRCCCCRCYCRFFLCLVFVLNHLIFQLLAQLFLSSIFIVADWIKSRIWDTVSNLFIYKWNHYLVWLHWFHVDRFFFLNIMMIIL